MQATDVMTGEPADRPRRHNAGEPMDAGPARAAARDRLVCVGIIVGVHGVRGAVRVKSFTENEADVAAYGPLSDERGTRHFVLTPIGAARGAVLARIEGVDDRNAAELLRGVRLYADRNAFPSTEEDEFYHADLIGLAAETVAGESLGTVRAVYNHGAGDVIELALASGAMVALPFTKAVVPVVDLAGKRLVVDPPEGVLPDGPLPPGAGRRAE